ncbi:MAG: hypothetical protein RMK19_04385 [Bacteroidia bacterium]|nr:hypothetical protein [Bacteroidia bacterium]MDW8015229.1 hypothetical protein [Bacteroidia bacterium]
MKTAISVRLRGDVLRGEVQLPLSKSLSNRQIMMGAQAQCSFEIEGVSEAQDTQDLCRTLVQLGYRIAQEKTKWWFIPPRSYPKEVLLYVGEGGTTLRFLLPWLARLPTRSVVEVGPSLRGRPIAPLLRAMQAAGASLFIPLTTYPLEISGNPKWRPTNFHIDSTFSSQFLSALFLLAPHLEKGAYIGEESAQPATPAYSEMTRLLLWQKGWEWHCTTGGWRLERQPLPSSSVAFKGEGDWSAASFFFGWAALAGFEGFLPLPLDTLQPEQKLFTHLKWGYDFSLAPGGLLIRPTEDKLPPIEADLTDFPDALIVLTVAAAFAEGPSRLKGIQTLPYKETHRINALAQELRKVGAEVQVDQDALVISPTRRKLIEPLFFESHGDHRIAMALSMIAAKAKAPLFIVDPHCVLKSFPMYWRVLESLGAECIFSNGE